MSSSADVGAQKATVQANAAISRAELTASKTSKPTARAVSETSLSINQQLHLLASVGGDKPTTKRKRGSLDQHLGFSVKAQQPVVELRRIGFIGAGNIARAIAEGWISSGMYVGWGIARVYDEPSRGALCVCVCGSKWEVMCVW